MKYGTATKKKVRKRFLRRYSKECDEVCYRIERKGGTSNRVQVNKRFLSKAFLQNKTNNDGSLDYYPTYIDYVW